MIKLAKLKDIELQTSQMLEVSTFQGLSNMIRTKRSLFKLMWLISFFVSLSACVYYQVKTLIDYFEYEVVTTITTIPESNQEFPTITLCNAFNKSFELRFTHFYFNHHDWKDEWKDHFEVYNDTSYGRCFRFNSGFTFNGTKVGILKSSGVVRTNGLEFGLYLETESDFNNIIIYFHNYTFRPTGVFGREHFVSMGAFHNFVIERIISKKLDEPYNDCLNDVSQFKKNKTIIDYFIQTNQKYSQEECFKFCERIYFNETAGCDCSLNSLEDIIYSKCVDPDEDGLVDNCTAKFMAQFSDKNTLESCDSYCPLECESISLNIVSNSFIFPKSGNLSKDVANLWVNKFDTFENFSRGFIGFNVYYKDLKYTFISQQAKMKIFDLISNIGGLFGLFLGMGLLSFVEIIEIILENCILVFKSS